MKLKKLKIKDVTPNPFQPRERFDKEKIQELADNINKHGMIEPIVVTKRKGKYMIVAGERRWRANKKAKKEYIYAIDKEYKNDSDIKRDSLVENEMRENLKDEEFKAFTFSLAKSLGKPYFNKGFIHADKLAEYLIGGNYDRVHNSKIRKKIQELMQIRNRGSFKLKKNFEEGKIDRKTAAKISGIKDKETQDELAEMAKHKSTKEIRQTVQRHNFQQKAKEAQAELMKESDKDKVYRSEQGVVLKFKNKIREICGETDYFNDHIKDNRKILAKFSHESKMDMLDMLKPLKRDLEKSLHLVTKLMEDLSK